MAAAGPRGIAFTIGRARDGSIAVAETRRAASTSRIAPGKGPISSMASSPDGKTLYFSASGKIWAVPSAGGEPRLIRSGDGVVADPSGRSLVIGTVEGGRYDCSAPRWNGVRSMRSPPTVPYRSRLSPAVL